jgi:diadenylate cyclase
MALAVPVEKKLSHSPRLMEPGGLSFYTVLVYFETLTRLFGRLGGEGYPLYGVATELLLIGLLVNWCAGILHGTRGTRLLRGLLVVLVAATLIVSVLAEQLGWVRLDLLYRYFIFGMAFIALVAFQPELRRALIRAGEMRFMRRVEPHGKLISSLVESVGYLSRNRYGALVAIQRDVGLANWTEHGTQLNAEVSANLIKTVFYPNSALHDLGVVIRGNRVLAAGCQFPVAESGEVDASLGSRHRAAVGLSSESDALVLVVSEETGTISLADGGKLTRFLALDDLEEELEARLAGHPSAHRRRRLRTLSDAWRVLRRLLVVVPLTLVIWFLADQASLTPPEDMSAELTITHDATLHVDVVQPSPALFALTVRGPTRGIEALRVAAAEGPVKLTWVLPTHYARPGRPRLEKEELRAVLEGLPALKSRGVFVEDVSPDSLEFVVDDVATFVAPVQVDAGALQVAVERIEPDRVQVWLRQSDLTRLQEQESERRVSADLEKRLIGEPRNRVLSFSGVVLAARIGEVELLRVDPRAVDIRLRIVAERVQRRLENVPVYLAVSPQVWQRYDIEVRDANEWLLALEVEGDEAVVNALRVQDVHAFVSLSSDQAVSSEEFRSMEVAVELPEGITLMRPSPQVRFRLVPREGTTP